MKRPQKDDRGIEARYGGLDDDGKKLPADHATFYLHTKSGMFELVQITGSFDGPPTADEISEIDRLIRAANPQPVA